METYIAIGVLTIINIIGWVLSSNRYSRNEAMHLGKMEGTIKGLSDRIESLENRIDSMEKRINGFFISQGDPRAKS